MFANVIWDAVRVAEQEIRSARPDAPVVDEPVRERGSGRGYGIRVAVSGRLHRLADALEPAPRPVGEPRFTPDAC